MSRRVVITLGSALVVAGALLFVWVSMWGPTGQRMAAVTFAGYTNADFQGRGLSQTCAIFCLSNSTAKRIGYYAESIDTWTPAGWQMTILRCTPTNWYRFGTTLDPGEVSVFYVPPQDAERWRVQVTCREKAVGFQGIKARIFDYRDNLRRGQDGSRAERFSGLTYRLSSPEVRP